MPFRIFAVAVSMIILVGPAVAAEVDVSKLTCKQAGEMGPVATGLIAAYAAGYADAKNNSTMVEAGTLTANIDKVKDACAKTPDATVASVIQGLK